MLSSTYDIYQERLEYWIGRAKAGKLSLEAGHIIASWKNDREKLLAEIYELKEGVPHP